MVKSRRSLSRWLKQSKKLQIFLVWRIQVPDSAGPGHSVLSDRTHPSHATSFQPGLPRYHHLSHTGMCLCQDERSTTETESIDKSFDSFQVAIQCADSETKTKCNTLFKLIKYLRLALNHDNPGPLPAALWPVTVTADSKTVTKSQPLNSGSDEGRPGSLLTGE